MSNFIKFTAKAATKPELGRDFSNVLQHATPESLYNWFREYSFAVQMAECAKLVAQREAVLQLDSNAWGPFQY